MRHMAATPQSVIMKISTHTILAACLCLFAGCDSLNNPLAGLFRGHDERVYNSQTGEWEYPNKKGATPAPQKSAAVASALASTPAPQKKDPHSMDWVEKHSPSPSPSAGSSTQVASNPNAPVKPSADPAASEPAPTPPPRPGRATGYYNTQTGKIDWQNSGETTAAATPAPTKHWWWPF
jgi:hypothetical protein